MTTFADIFDLLGSREGLARTLNEKGVTVRQWGRRNYLPAHHFDRIVSLCREAGHPEITHETLSKIAAAAKEARATKEVA